MIIFLILTIIILSFYTYKKEIKIKKILLYSFILLMGLFSFKTFELLESKTIEVIKENYLLTLTYYYPGDATGSGTYLPGLKNNVGALTSAGKLKIENPTKWYLYNESGIDYLVIATATNACLNVKSTKDACYKYRQQGKIGGIKYRNYGDKLVIQIGTKKYNAIVADSCGECMKAKYATNEKIDIFTSGKGATNPGSYSATVLSEDPSNTNNATEFSSLDGNGEINYTTTYTGDLKKGWLYLRFKGEIIKEGTDAEDIEKNIDDAINEIFRRTGEYVNTGSNDVKTGMEGKTIYGQTIASNLPDYIKTSMQSPFNDQTCKQSSCFGYYSSGTCSTHSGVDLVSSANASIYAVYDGIVTGVNYSSKQCNPQFVNGKNASCGPGCSGNIITIKHSINGEEWYTKYVHMSSIDESIRLNAAVTKGQKIGIIGTSGCSTGVHLHFELIGPNKTLYNPEELLTGKCNLNSSCNYARQSCQG